MNNYFKYNDKYYNIIIVKKKNKNTYIRVKDSSIIITTNYLISKREVCKLIDKNKESIIKLINKSNIKKEKEDNFYLFGKCYNVIKGNFSDIEITGNKIFVNDDKTLTKWLNNIIINTYQDKLNYWYNKFTENIPQPNLKIRNMSTRWGVCNMKNKNITLNYNLYKYDTVCLDYVIIHELSHFIHPNHSKEFWYQVSKYCPNYKEIRKKLKE